MTACSVLELDQIRDNDQIQTVMTDLFAPHSLAVDQGSALNGSVCVRTAGRVRLVWVTYGAPCQLDVRPPPRPFHLVQIPLRGSLSVRSGRDEIASSPCLASIPDTRLPCLMRWDAECAEVVVRIEEDTLQEHLECLLGHPIRTPIRFSLGMSLLSGVGSSWRAAVDLLIAEINRPEGLLQSPVVAAQLEALILTGLLTAQPHNYTAALRAEPTTPPPRAIRKALEYIETEHNLAMTTARVAAHAGMSARALQRGFQEHVGCSPMDYLRDVRLKWARDVLGAADASSDLTVTQVALESGFMHMGRFSVQYRRRFGESPSETLRR